MRVGSILKRLALAFAALVAIVVVIVMVFVGRSYLWPVEDVAVVLPVNGAVAHIQVWGNTLSDGRFELLVENGQGKLRSVLWENWGPAYRVSLYLTPDRRLVVGGGGGIVEMFEILADAPPRPVADAAWAGTDGEDWQYLGVVDRAGSTLRFFSSAEQKECLPMYTDESDSPYRKSHQGVDC
jgi:hypothetical protein